jgi:hypothetical protein
VHGSDERRGCPYDGNITAGTLEMGGDGSSAQGIYALMERQAMVTTAHEK